MTRCEFFAVREVFDNMDMIADVNDDGGYFTKPELVKIALEAIALLGCWDCFSCGVDTFALGEDFYVHNELWNTYGVEGVLCIGCFEIRLGRRLVSTDFKGDGGGPADHDPTFPGYRRSERFKDRVMTGSAA